MTPGLVTEPRTALDVLCGTGQDSPQAAAARTLAPAIRHHVKALAGVPEALRPAAAGAVAAAAGGLLGFGLVGLIVDGWREHRDLKAAALRTVEVPGTIELVRLGEHRITVSKEPSISILVNGEQVSTVALEVTLTFDITAVLGEVSGGMLTALHSGRCNVTAELAIDHVVLLTRYATIELPGAISLGRGLQLLPQHEMHH